MLGALSASVVRSLQALEFGIAAGLTFESVGALKLLPQNTTVECVEVSDIPLIVLLWENVERSKQALGHHDRTLKHYRRRVATVYRRLDYTKHGRVLFGITVVSKVIACL
ncbi:hypothetical protein MRX96_024173 [Rhipicephalus microplus]